MDRLVYVLLRTYMGVCVCATTATTEERGMVGTTATTTPLTKTKVSCIIIRSRRLKKSAFSNISLSGLFWGKAGQEKDPNFHKQMWLIHIVTINLTIQSPFMLLLGVCLHAVCAESRFLLFTLYAQYISFCLHMHRNKMLENDTRHNNKRLLTWSSSLKWSCITMLLLQDIHLCRV